MEEEEVAGRDNEEAGEMKWVGMEYGDIYAADGLICMVQSAVSQTIEFHKSIETSHWRKSPRRK